MEPLKLKIRPGTATYKKGEKRIGQILEAARDLMIESGYHSLSMRKIAARTNMTVGNLNYYYPDKESLLRDLIDHIMKLYLAELGALRETVDGSPREVLEAELRWIARDLGSESTSRFFPELWALSNHDPYAKQGMERLYSQGREHFSNLVAEINPALTEKNRDRVILFVTASMEGLTPFVGYGKPFNADIPAISNIAVKALVDLVSTITNEDVDKLT